MAARIYADFNGLVRGVAIPDRVAAALDTIGSLRDLANAGIRLEDGMALIAFDESDEFEDLEGHGTARYDYFNKRWVVEFDEARVRYVPRQSRSENDGMRCVHRRHPFDPEMSLIELVRLGGTCAVCGTPVDAPIESPARGVR